MFDAHNHLDRCADPIAELLAARQAGVLGQLVAGVDPTGWAAQADLAHEPDIHVCYGVHPWTAAHASPDELTQMLAALPAALDTGSVALGELGLDRSRHLPADSVDAQRHAFRVQLALARERDLPVVLHIVQAHGVALDLLRRDGLPAAGGMVHSASTPVELVPAYLDLGLYLSFAGSVTHHRKARAAAAAVPLERLLAETDAPGQAPAGRAAPNRPAWLGDIVGALADLHGVDAAHMAALTAVSARRLFRLPDPS